jgi:hypothetical protein
VFIHGAGRTPASWGPQLARFEGALAVALPGHPDGQPLEGTRAMADWVIAEVGEAHQSCPILILDGELDWPEAQDSETTGRRFLQDHAIAPYLEARYGVGRPHP